MSLSPMDLKDVHETLQTETERDRNVKKCLETVSQPRCSSRRDCTFLVISIDVLMKFRTLLRLLPKMNKAKSQ